ncbi:uncharacterized protein UTRI_00823 [Ustilago trichophora]|uniref:DDE Tnp4 domain-containing protein n=1 Tax=Ustilago trichophora TaxID=86804 RepID=A0A5C3DVZ4_9BASI|nr:uncharacterized protein UTRI_00823 [Ustilago trichophora]
MVRYSSKQKLLNDILCTLETTIPTELEEYCKRVQGLDAHSYNSPGDSEDSDDDDPIPLSRHLVSLYAYIADKRYTTSRTKTVQRTDTLINLLDRMASSNVRTFRGLVRMSPEAFDKLALRIQQTPSFGSGSLSLNRVRQILSVGLYRLGRSGNGGGERDASLQCGCSVGSLVAWTERTVSGLMEMNKEVMQFASEQERKQASSWVRRVTGVEEWGKGWLVVDGTHIPLAWKPAMHAREHYSYKGFHSLNVALVVMPHSLRIVESVVGQPGSAQDSRVWASGSNILKKPRLYLDEGEFIWVDGGYGHSAFTVGPFSHIAAEKSRDL